MSARGYGAEVGREWPWRRHRLRRLLPTHLPPGCSSTECCLARNGEIPVERTRYRIFKTAYGDWLPYDPLFVKRMGSPEPRLLALARMLRNLENFLIPMSALTTDLELRNRVDDLLVAILQSWDEDLSQALARDRTRFSFRYCQQTKCLICDKPLEENDCDMAQTFRDFHHPANLSMAHEHCRKSFERGTVKTKPVRPARLDIMHRHFSRTQTPKQQLTERKIMAEVATRAFRERTGFSERDVHQLRDRRVRIRRLYRKTHGQPIRAAKTPA